MANQKQNRLAREDRTQMLARWAAIGDRVKNLVQKEPVDRSAQDILWTVDMVLCEKVQVTYNKQARPDVYLLTPWHRVNAILSSLGLPGAVWAPEVIQSEEGGDGRARSYLCSALEQVARMPADHKLTHDIFDISADQEELARNYVWGVEKRQRGDAPLREVWDNEFRRYSEMCDPGQILEDVPSQEEVFHYFFAIKNSKPAAEVQEMEEEVKEPSNNNDGPPNGIPATPVKLAQSGILIPSQSPSRSNIRIRTESESPIKKPPSKRRRPQIVLDSDDEME